MNDSDSRKPGERRLAVAGLAIIIMVEIALCGRFLNAGPIGDDDDEFAFVQGAGSFSQLLRGDCYGLFRPAKNVMFYAAARLSPTTMWPRHALSLVLFAACTLLAFVWLRKRFSRPAWALAGTSAWALAPTQVSSVAWFSCANILAGACCVLGGSLLYDKYRAHSAEGNARQPWLLAGICFLYALAILSYESFLVMPALLALEDAARRGIDWRSKHFRLPYAGMAVVAALCLTGRQLAQSSYSLHNSNFGPIAPLQLSFASAWLTVDHLRVFFWPFGQQRITSTFVWGVTAPIWQLALCWALLLSVGTAAVALRRHIPLLGFGVAWLFLSFLPMSNLIPLRSGPYGDYYLVIPSLGLVAALLAIAEAVAEKFTVRRSLWAPAALIAAMTVWRGACGLLAFYWGAAWNSEELLWSRTLAARPDAFTVRAELARVRLVQGRLDEAQSLAAAALAQAPWQEHAYHVLGDVYLRRGDSRSAAAMYRAAIKANSGGVYPYFGLGYIQETFTGNLEGAAANYGRVLAARWNQSSAGAARNLCRVLLKLRRPDDAVRVIEAAVARQPASPELHYSAAIAWKARGDLARAQAHLDRFNALRGAEPSTPDRFAQSDANRRSAAGP